MLGSHPSINEARGRLQCESKRMGPFSNLTHGGGMRAFWRGFLSCFDLFGTIRDPRIDEILNRTDAEALAHDWQMVGQDMRRAIEGVNRGR